MNLNAACRTPRVHRQELLKHVHRPKFIRFIYTPETDIDASSALSRLKAVYKAAEAWSNKSTSNGLPWTPNQRSPANDVDQLKRFCAKATHVHQELGAWASEYYIYESILRFKNAVNSRKYTPFRAGDREDNFILDKLQEVCIDGRSQDTAPFPGKMAISEKAEQLIQFLTSHDEAQRYGIVFVEQRATVAVLHKLLSTHPMTSAIVKCSTFVGTSANSSRKTYVGEWLDSSHQQDTLVAFRNRERNLIIATSVLEEGIDISACNTVICFNKPENLKSFIQRRGRARKEESIFVLMLSSEDEPLGPSRWEELEREMTETYQQDAVKRQEAQRLEDIEELSDRTFKIESTGYVSLILK
jgi:ERCC4-related helicase